MPRAQAKSCVGTAAPGCPAEQNSATTTAAQRANTSSSAKATTRTSSAADELVVYEKGKVIFRMKPAAAKPDQAKHRQAKPDSTTHDSDSVVEASSTTKIAATKLAPTKIATTKIAPTKVAPAQSVWLSPAQAETRLLRRTEPQYPPAALAAHRAGNVVLEVQVAEDGSVASVRTLSGDPLLAAAATEAVRNWRYQPYRQHDHPAQFQTDVTLSFTLPN
jgi:TonB family protein